MHPYPMGLCERVAAAVDHHEGSTRDLNPKVNRMPWNLPWNSDLTNVRNVLAGLYSTREDSYRVVDSAGLPRMHVAFSDKAINNWHSILTEAAQRGKVLAVIEAALQEYPDNSWLRHARQQGDLPIRGPVFGEDRVWEEPSDLSLLEKIIGAQSTLLPINFLEVGLVRARSVARIVCPDCLGTGFLIDNNLLITNHHVLENETSAASGRPVQLPEDS